MSQKFNLLISNEEIQKEVKRLADEISDYYQGKELIILCVLEGARNFFYDLSKSISIPFKIEYIKVSSYGNDSKSSGKVKLKEDLRTNLKDKHVLIIEDIIDTGKTIYFLNKYLQTKNPSSLNICSFLQRISNSKNIVNIKFIGKWVDKGFLVGYGLDYANNYRDLKDIYILNI